MNAIASKAASTTALGPPSLQASHGEASKGGARFPHRRAADPADLGRPGAARGAGRDARGPHPAD